MMAMKSKGNSSLCPLTIARFILVSWRRSVINLVIFCIQCQNSFILHHNFFPVLMTLHDLLACMYCCLKIYVSVFWEVYNSVCFPICVSPCPPLSFSCSAFLSVCFSSYVVFRCQQHLCVSVVVVVVVSIMSLNDMHRPSSYRHFPLLPCTEMVLQIA